jgi:hypothetical protein
MAEVKFAVGDQVRIHLHPADPWKSFSEGVVSRVDVTTAEGRFFVVEVMHEVLLDREHRIKRGFPDYVRYECRNDFPGRIEVLSTTTDMEQEPAVNLMLMDPLEETKQEAKTEIERALEAEIVSKPTQVEIDRQPAPARSGLIATLFGRKE